MKISELTKVTQPARSMELPVSIAGENQAITLGQIIDALSAAIVPFDGIDDEKYFTVSYGHSPTVSYPVRWVPSQKAFYAVQNRLQIVAGVIRRIAVFYEEWPGSEQFYAAEEQVRTDCLFIAGDGRLYRFNGEDLISAGVTDDQAELLKKLTPQRVESESDLEAMQAAGVIVPGQIYYIPEND